MAPTCSRARSPEMTSRARAWYRARASGFWSQGLGCLGGEGGRSCQRRKEPGRRGVGDRGEERGWCSCMPRVFRVRPKVLGTIPGWGNMV